MSRNKLDPKVYTKPVTYKYTEGRVKKSETVTVLIYEDQPEQLTEETAAALFEQYPDVKEIHELNDKWGGRWTRTKPLTRCQKS